MSHTSQKYIKGSDLPLLQAKNEIALGALGDEVRDAPPARLAVIAGAVGCGDVVLDDLLAGRGGMELGLCAEAAGEGQAGDGVGGRGAEGAGGLGGIGHAQGRAQRGEEGRHGWMEDVELLDYKV